MRIISYNVNGIRSAFNKGFLDWLAGDPADVICLQEIKANKEQIDIAAIEALGYHTFWFSAQKPGYSGVGIISRIRPDAVFTGNSMAQSDHEGRVLRADFGALTIINAYFPSGSSGDARQAYKYQWLDEFSGYIDDLRKERPALIICGDYNICHQPIDIHNPKSNAQSSGFLPEERAWLSHFFEDGFTDAFRHFNKDPHHYSWWSFRGGARGNNKGWRIDYISVSAMLNARLLGAAIYPDVIHSDHCPVFVELAA